MRKDKCDLMNHTNKHFLFLGQTGSGKTELAVNMALSLAQEKKTKICFIDMDQTKGLFRARDLKEKLEEKGIRFLKTTQFQDSPIVPQGVTGALADKECTCIFDVGGNSIGARMVGQYAPWLNKSLSLYVINPNRPFSSDESSILSNMEMILSAGRILWHNVKIISNPCMGEETTPEDIVAGHDLLTKSLTDCNIALSALTVKEGMEDIVRQRVSCPVYPIKIFVRPLYQI